MRREVALIKVNDNMICQFLIKIKKLFSKKLKENNKTEVAKTVTIDLDKREIDIESNSKDDFTYLKEILEGKIKINDLDRELKKRLTKLCNERLREVDREILKKERQIKKAQEILEKVNNV